MNEEKELLKYIAARQNPDVAVRDKFEELKPVVPQFVADWYEEHKDNFEEGVYDLFVEFYEDRRELDTELYQWFKLDGNKQVETLVKMKLFGYEIEKEKLYTVEIPTHCNPDHFVLRKHIDGRVCLDCYRSDNWRNYKCFQLTEAEIKREHDWAWQFAEEVNNNND